VAAAGHSLLLLILALLLAACAVREPVQPSEQQVLRILLQVEPASDLDPASNAGLARLMQRAGVPLDYLRTAGSGHLLVTRAPVDRAAADAILQRLTADPAIVAAEEDRRMIHQSKQLQP
jgi:hypothetical protein